MTTHSRPRRTPKACRAATPSWWNAHEETYYEEIQAVLSRCGVVVFPTETVYGLGGRPDQENTLHRIFAVKQRNPMKPLPLVAADLESAVKAFSCWPKMAAILAARFWPGPLTLVLPVKPELPKILHAGKGWVAVRVSSHSIARKIASMCGGLTVATSANLSGTPAVSRIKDIPEALLSRVDGIVDGGVLPPSPPSTIVMVDPGGNSAKVLRSGCLQVKLIDQVLRSHCGVTLQGLRGGEERV